MVSSHSLVSSLRSRVSRGFTLIELLVTVAIFIFMTALIVSRYGAFNQGTLMTNLAYDVALSIRTAQSFGVSVKGTDDTGRGFTQSFNSAYGVHLAVSSSVPASFFTFLDNNTTANPANGIYSVSDGDTQYSTYTLKQGAKIAAICLGTSGQTCDAGTFASVDISFRRPDPSAIICMSGGCVSGGTAYNYAKITLASADGSSSRNVIVRGNGQISVTN